MDRHNGNRDTVQFLVNLKRFPEKAASLIAAYNARRFNRVLTARSTRPLVLPISYATAAPGNAISPTPGRTQRLNYPVEILAGAHNFNGGNADQLAISKNGEINYGVLPDTSTVRFSVDDFGGSPAKGPSYFPVPIELGRVERLFADYYRPSGVIADQLRYFCFVGQRTFPPNSVEGGLSDPELVQVKSLINSRLVPETRVISMRVLYPAAAAGSEAKGMKLAGRSEPLLIRALRTSALRHSLVTFSIENEEPWMPAPAPVWSIMNCLIATGAGPCDTNWQFLETPFYLPKDQNLVANFVSSGDDESASFDSDDTGAAQRFLAVSFLAETM